VVSEFAVLQRRPHYRKQIDPVQADMPRGEDSLKGRPEGVPQPPDVSLDGAVWFAVTMRHVFDSFCVKKNKRKKGLAQVEAGGMPS
jgi:hypothetical protein